MRSASLKPAVLVQRTSSTSHSVPRFRLPPYHFSAVSTYMRRIWLMIFLIGGLTSLLSFGFIAYSAAYYDERVLPGVQVGEVPVGGMTRSELTSFLQSVGDRLVGNGLRFRFQAGAEPKTFFLSPVVVNEGTAIDLMAIDVEKGVEQLLAYGKEGGYWSRVAAPIRSRLTRPSITLKSVMIDSPRILHELQEELALYEEPVREATIQITALEPLDYRRVFAAPGRVFLYVQIIRD